MSDDLLYMSATEALSRFAAKTLSPVELLEAQIARAEAVKDPVNAFTFTHFDEALDAARASEARWGKGAPAGALDGLTVAIKDESYVAGKPTSGGSLTMKDHVAEHTTPVNERILGEQALMHARTATPEFSCAGFTWSRLWGVTRNPWNPEFTPGGSSGGSAAALAAGTTTLATGSDIGGSIRIPASCCGLVGYKPPYGRNPDDIPFNLDFYCHTGPLARTVQDAILLQNVMCGPHPRDIASLHPKLTLPDLKGWRVALSMDLGSYRVSEEVRRSTLAAAEVFRGLGATVEEVDLGWGDEVQAACMTYLDHLFGGAISAMLDEHADDLTSYARAFAEKAQDSTARDFVRSLEVAGESFIAAGAALASCYARSKRWEELLELDRERESFADGDDERVALLHEVGRVEVDELGRTGDAVQTYRRVLEIDPINEEAVRRLDALLEAAEQAGCVAVDGLGMLLHQAVPAFERWFGVRPDVDEAARAAALA